MSPPSLFLAGAASGRASADSRGSRARGSRGSARSVQSRTVDLEAEDDDALGARTATSFYRIARHPARDPGGRVLASENSGRLTGERSTASGSLH